MVVSEGGKNLSASSLSLSGQIFSASKISVPGTVLICVRTHYISLDLCRADLHYFVFV